VCPAFRLPLGGLVLLAQQKGDAAQRFVSAHHSQGVAAEGGVAAQGCCMMAGVRTAAAH
jgi:hypothetical protein